MISLTSPIETRAHRWPAGVKLAALCVATMGLFAMQSVIGHAVSLALCMILFAIPGRVFFMAGLRGLRVLTMFVVIIFVWHGLAGTWAAGAVIVLRLMTAVGLATLVTMTTRLTDLVAVVTWALTPLRRLGLSTRAVEISIALVIRFTPVLAMKGAQLVSAWRARSPRRPSPRILMPMVILAIDDAEYVAEALRARGGV